MDRITFFNSISGIDYPKMLVKFYDQFLALKELVIEPSLVNVISNLEDEHITFSIKFTNKNDIQYTLSILNSYNLINVYGKMITVNIDSLTDTELILTLK